jgi:hypothetical protein
MRSWFIYLGLGISGCGLIAPLDEVDRGIDGKQVIASGGANAGSGGSGGELAQTAGAAGSGGTASAGSGGTECKQRSWPARPDIPDSGDQETLFALRLDDLSKDANAWRSVGFNLDAKCTAPPKFDRECKPRGNPDAPFDTDGDDGIDNNIGQYIWSSFLNQLQTNLIADQQRGAGVLILRIFDWNGTPNDRHVRVWILNSVHPGADIENPAAAPQWLGNDTWNVESTAFTAEGVPQAFDDDAYIADGRLVAYPNQAEIKMDSLTQTLLFKLTDMRIVGTLSSDAQRLQNVILGGRWRLNDIYGVLEDVGLCEGNPNTANFKTLLQGFADTYSTVAPESQPECNAISLGLRFQGFHGIFGRVVETKIKEPGCSVSSGAGGAAF